MAGGHTHIVQRGETLSRIARRHGVAMRALAQHNGIRDVDLIRVGQRLVVPRAAIRTALPAAVPRVIPRPSGASGDRTQKTAGSLILSAMDVLNLKKTLQTEWVQSAGVDQAHGILDTILNRTASRHWGQTVADVVNARNQFSDINGPISRRHGRDGVAQLPTSVISRRVHQVTDQYLAARSTGRGSIIGSHLNYANPHYSDAKNLAWINALDGPRLGRGKAIHYHGTTPSLQRYRPGRFNVQLPSSEAVAAPTLPGRRTNGNAVAATNGVQVKSGGVRLGQLDSAMESVIRAVAEVAQGLRLPTPVITSGNDSRHGTKSLHYADRALDFRGNNISIAQGQALREGVRQRIGKDYDVVFETFSNSSNNHLHVEYDPD